MKSTPKRRREMLTEYRLDYAKAKPNRFARVAALKPSTRSTARALTASQMAKIVEILESLKANLASRPTRSKSIEITLAPDVARGFPDPESANAALRNLLAAARSRRAG